jgi:t-SNARE complex subunit (syntaxin)
MINEVKIINRIADLVINTMEPQNENFVVYWNDETKVFSATSHFDGKVIDIQETMRTIEKNVKRIQNLSNIVYVYRNRDDALVKIESIEEFNSSTHEELQEYYEYEMDGLFIGWD